MKNRENTNVYRFLYYLAKIMLCEQFGGNGLKNRLEGGLEF